jgi:hypothetical protein
LIVEKTADDDDQWEGGGQICAPMGFGRSPADYETLKRAKGRGTEKKRPKKGLTRVGNLFVKSVKIITSSPTFSSDIRYSTFFLIELKKIFYFFGFKDKMGLKDSLVSSEGHFALHTLNITSRCQ